MKLFVAGLPSDFDDVDFKEMFELYGTVLSAKIIVDHNTKKSKGFGFLDMPIDSEAQSVISTLNDVKMAGKPLVIKEATEQAQRPATGGGGFRPQQRSNFSDSRPRYNNNRDNNNRDYNRGDRGDYNRDRDNRGGGGYNRDNNRDSYNRDNNRDRDNNNRDRSSGNRY